MSSLTLENGILVYKTPYDPGLVAALKAAIPATDRKWEPSRKVWLVAPTHGRTLADLTSRFLGENIGVPRGQQLAMTETRILEIRYIGATKDRGDGSPTAFGLDHSGDWSVIFPETVLREWFNAEARPDEVTTLYAVLGIKADAAETDIKTAYRRLVRVWHPDVCREPDATEQFRRIQHAYEILQDPRSRAKYNAGLALEASLRSQRDALPPWESVAAAGYRSPLRCGMIMAEGCETLGRFVVEKILAWQDIVDDMGRVLVTSWPAGGDAPVESWN